jgi:glycosyltransferase involved in cell wall biosynthesis
MVWGPPSHGPRSQVFARELGIQELHFISGTTKRGLWAAPYKYGYQAVKTLWLLFQKRPRVVFIQSPPSFAVLFVYLYCVLMNGRYIIDAHSDALLSPYWTRPRWLHRFLARKAVTTIVTNEHFQQMINEQGGHAFVLRDIPTTFTRDGSYSLNGDFNVVVVNTFAADEPLTEILSAAADLEGVQFHVTGKKSRAGDNFPKNHPANVKFTDFLPNETYYALLAGSQAIMCLTTRNHTMQRGACEALSLGKPIITSKWPLLETYFNMGTVHVDNSINGIRQGVKEMQREYGRYQTEIKELQKEQQQEWQTKIALLTNLIQQSLASK